MQQHGMSAHTAQLHGCSWLPTQPRPRSLAVRRAAAVTSPVGGQAPATTSSSIKNAVALKEWAVAIEALARGEQTVLLRKGGIKEPIFNPPQPSFLLFPTSFHSDNACLKPGVAERYQEALALEPKQEKQLPINVWAEVTAAWVTEDAGVLSALDDLHIWTQGFVDARLKWRQKQPLTLLELRAWRLPPLTLQVHEELFGCFSFVDLSQGLASDSPPSSPSSSSTSSSSASSSPASLAKVLTLAGAVPALSDAEFAQRQALLRGRLAKIDARPLLL